MILSKRNAVSLAFTSLGTGLFGHFYTTGFVRNHLPDVSWLCFGIFLFYRIWGHFRYSHYPLGLALVWEASEFWLRGRTFDLIDIGIYIIVYGCFIWFNAIKHTVSL